MGRADPRRVTIYSARPMTSTLVTQHPMPFTPAHIKPHVHWLTNFLSCCSDIHSFCKVLFGDAHAAFRPKPFGAPVCCLLSLSIPSSANALTATAHFAAPRAMYFAYFHCHLIILRLPTPTPPFTSLYGTHTLSYLVLAFLFLSLTLYVACFLSCI